MRMIDQSVRQKTALEEQNMERHLAKARVNSQYLEEKSTSGASKHNSCHHIARSVFDYKHLLHNHSNCFWLGMNFKVSESTDLANRCRQTSFIFTAGAGILHQAIQRMKVTALWRWRCSSPIPSTRACCHVGRGEMTTSTRSPISPGTPNLSGSVQKHVEGNSLRLK